MRKPGWQLPSHPRLSLQSHKPRTILGGRCRLLSHGHVTGTVDGNEEKLSHYEKTLIVKLVDIVDFINSLLSHVHDHLGLNPIILVVTEMVVTTAKKNLNIDDFLGGGDVYLVESPDGFTINQVLDAHWGVLKAIIFRVWLLDMHKLKGSLALQLPSQLIWMRDKPVDVSDQTVTLELTGDLDQMITLKRLLEPYVICEVARTEISSRLRETYGGSTIENIIITIPAYFHDSQRQAKKDKKASLIDGLHIIFIINESMTVSIVYDLEKKATKVGEKNMVIFDLGDDIFDVSFLTIKESVFEVKVLLGTFILEP
ncbi:hypothetical protein GQ457_05G015650 [Hibiscus cannabinus]